jgi:hypothetical protein
VFAVHLDGSNRVDAVMAYFEGSDSVELRDAANRRHGAPMDEQVLGGFRTWRWRVGPNVLTVGGYERGAFIGWIGPDV